MQITLNSLTSPVRSLAAGTWVALSALLALCLGASTAMAVSSPPPIVVTGPTVLIGDLQFGGATGGWPGGQAPLGGTFVVGPNGDVIVGDGYGGCASCGVFLITPAGVQSVLANFGNSNAAGMDQYGNAYVARDYGSSIIKLPYNAATGTYTGFTTLPTTNCLGGTQDTAACVFAPGTQALFAGENGGFSSLFFDGQGNFFFSTDANPANNPDTIYECSALCQAETDGNGTHPAVVVYADASGGLGSVAIDPWGNLFFSDGADNGANSGKTSYLQELPFTAGHYAASPTQITSYTTTAGYNAITGVSANNLNTVFFTVANDGVFALPNSSSGPNAAGIYKVSGQGGQGLAVDSVGNLYVVGYNNTLTHTGVMKTLFNNVPFAASPVGTAAAAATITATDSAGNCTTPPTLSFTGVEGGIVSTEFATVAGTSCSTAVGTGSGTFSPALASTGASYSATITFTPTAAGKRNAALVIADSTNSASGTAALTGVGQGAYGNVDPGVSTAYGTGFTKPYSVSVDALGDLAVADETGGLFWIPAGSPAGTAPTSIGTGFVEPDATAFDASGNLYIADFSNNNVVKIPYVGGALAPGSQFTLIASTFDFNGTALNEPSGLAVGPDGRLYVADLGNNRVVSYNPVTGETSVPLTGLKNPWGIAVDSSNNLYVADTGNSNVLIDTAAGVQSTLTVPGVSAPWGIKVDASGSLIVSDHASGNIVWVPNVSGTLTTANAVTIEKNPSSALGIALDAAGDLYTTDATGKAVYAIQRTAAALNLGTVSDGITNSATVYLESTGNLPATLATPDVTEPANTMFTLVPAASDGCSSGSAGPPGSSCQFTGTFAPPPATADGLQAGVATVLIATPAASFSVNMSGTATVSSILSQTITGFSPPASLQVGQQITLSATGGDSGNPVVFSIDPSSACPTCATISGSVLTASAVGAVKVDANQAGGAANGNQYAAATQVQAPITISNTVVASDVPALLMSQINWSYQSGSFTDGQNPAGGSFAVTQNGLIYVGTTYSNKTDIVSQSTGALVQQIAMNGGGVFTIDSHNNLYMGHLYNTAVYKIPFVSGAYVALTDLSSAPNCTGTDTAICTVANLPSGGIKAVAFDASGNLYMVTVPSGTGVNAIYECAVACETGGTATLVYSDTTGAVSQIAFDPWGNLFFTDGIYNDSSFANDDKVTSSNLYELPFTSGTGFASTPTLLQTLTDASPANYDNQLDGVAVNSTGTIYYADQNDGMFAIPNTQTGGPDTAHQYVVSNLGAKGMELDASGNEWVVVYHSGGDNLGEALIGDLTAPNAQYQGAPVTTPATVVDNALQCSTAATLGFTSSNAEFGATAGTSCSTISAGTLSTPVAASSYTATITFTATKPDLQTATLTVADTTNGGQGTATVSGLSLTTPQTLSFTAPTNTTFTYAPGLTVLVQVANGPSNNPVAFTVDSSSAGAGTFSSTTVTGTTSSATLTVTKAGIIKIDANELGGLVGGTYYDAAPQVQLPITISQAAEAITFTPPTSPVVFTPGLTVNLSALGGGASTPVTFSVDASSTGAGSVSTTTVTSNTSTATLTVTQAGTIVLDANQASDVDYLAAPQVQEVLVVNQATQTIAFTPV
ncbi:MAG TPA: NHL repeat-containing protein, partial [Terracidiphilus sp.]